MVKAVNGSSPKRRPHCIADLVLCGIRMADCSKCCSEKVSICARDFWDFHWEVPFAKYTDSGMFISGGSRITPAHGVIPHDLIRVAQEGWLVAVPSKFRVTSRSALPAYLLEIQPLL